MTRIERSELKKVGRPGVKIDAGATPAGLAPILRASWHFAQDTAKRFSKELLNDRTKQFLDNLAKKFS